MLPEPHPLDRLDGFSTEIQLGFVEREATPRELMRLSIQLHLRGLLLSDTVSLLGIFGVNRARFTVHNGVQKADIQLTDGKSPDHVAVNETVIQLTDQRYWLYAAVDPRTAEFLHVRLFPTRNTAVTSIFFSEPIEKHDVEDAEFLIDDARELEAALRRAGFEYRTEIHGLRNSIKRIFCEVERRTSLFSNCFSHVEPPTADAWLRAFAVWWNHA